jgi:ABC-2 type transport system ATP-binding protein
VAAVVLVLTGQSGVERPYGLSALAQCFGSSDDRRVQVDPIIEVDRLGKRYGDVSALSGLSLTVPRGSVFGFLGPNGAGKTTTISLLLGLVEPSYGSARVLGFDIVSAADDIRARVGALLDENGLYEQLSAYENLLFHARAWRFTPRQAETRIHQLLSRIGLWDRRDDPAGSWSTGMQQRLALARAQLHDPELLFLDEPTAGLDVISARQVRHQLTTLAEEGKTIFLTTHNMSEAEELCARVAIIRDGQLVAEGEPTALLSESGYEVTIVGRHTDAAVQAVRNRPDVDSVVVEDGRLRLKMTSPDPSGVVSDLVACGASIQEVNRGTRLEDVFLELMEPSR